MRTDPIQIPGSFSEQEAELFRMYNGSRPLVYGSSRTGLLYFGSANELRITEALVQPPAANPLAAPLARQRSAYRMLQCNVLRGLWLALVILSFCALRAIFHSHDCLLIMPLWVLASSCVPLIMLATQGFTEVR